MARRAAGEQDDVSLFPFLSVLACVIGTLTLMIAALALGQMDNPTVASAERYEAVRAETARLAAEIAALKEQSAGLDEHRHQLDLAQIALDDNPQVSKNRRGYSP